MSDTKENVPVVSEEDEPINVEIRETQDTVCNVPVVVSLVQSESGNVDEDMGLDVPVVSKEEDEPINVEIKETQDDTHCNVLVGISLVHSESGVEEGVTQDSGEKNAEHHPNSDKDFPSDIAAENEEVSVKPTEEVLIDEISDLKTNVDGEEQEKSTSINHLESAEFAKDVEMGGSVLESPKESTEYAIAEHTSELPQSTYSADIDILPTNQDETQPLTAAAPFSDVKFEKVEDSKNGIDTPDFTTDTANGNSNSKNSFLWDDTCEGSESGTEEDQSLFIKELCSFFKERGIDFRPPKFYGGGLNLLKLWRSVTRLGGYDKVTACKLWRQVGESFRPPKTCTTVSWTFRGFYEKALLDYERHKAIGGELNIPIASHTEPMNVDIQGPGSGRARRDAAARAMQGWHSQRLLGNDDVSNPVIKDKTSIPFQKREKQLGFLKRKKPSYEEHTVKAARTKLSKPQLETAVVDIGPPADWVKINVQKTKDCFEIYALVPGLLREEVRVQTDPAGRLVISGEPLDAENPWGVTPFKKVVSLPSRIDSLQTSAVVTLHGQLFIRVPFELAD